MPSKTIKQYQEDPLHEDVRGFKIELSKRFPNIKPTSGFRKGAFTKFGAVSRHASGEALDYSFNDEVADYLWNTTEGIQLLNKHNLGFLDESKKGNEKWGNSLHIGKDTKLVERAKNRYKELINKSENVSYLPNPIQNDTFAIQPIQTPTIEPLVQQEQPKTTPQENAFLNDIFNQSLKGVEYVKPIQKEFQEGGIIEDNRGQWEHPGEITRIYSPNITMKNVNYPILGVSDTGEQKMMYPNQNYTFEGASEVTEYPQLTENEKNFLKNINEKINKI